MDAKKGFVAPIEKVTLANTDFRRVLYTGKHLQLVLMTLQPGEEIGVETHDTTDQFFRIESGKANVLINGKSNAVKDGDAIIVPSGALHNVINTSKTEMLKLYTLYAPPEHADKVIRSTRAQALEKEEHFDGKTTE